MSSSDSSSGKSSDSESENESSEKVLVPQWLKSAEIADAEGLTGSERKPCLRLTQAQVSAQTQTLDLSMNISHAMDQPIHACL